MDVAHKCSTAAVNKHAIGVNMLGGKAAFLTFTLIPAQTESEAVHTEAYHAMLRALRAFTAVKTCDSCECCQCISDLLTDHIVKCALCSPHYVTPRTIITTISKILHTLSKKNYVPYPKYYVPYPKYCVPYPNYSVPYPKFNVPYQKYYTHCHTLRWACLSTWPTCSRQ